MEEEKFFELKKLYSGLLNKQSWEYVLAAARVGTESKLFLEHLHECLKDAPESVNAPVAIDVNIKGLEPGKHGFHVHEFGGEGWNSAGPHFNPLNKNHGAPISKHRHIGDLGNVLANKDGVVETGFSDRVISLSGPYNVVGRMLCVDSFADDLGHGIDTYKEESLVSGNSGPIIACGVIAWAKP
uniref:Superoxide dismutase copper/zinc binding domain-containing protein n=1 Tax=Globodera rostochiensis TaxID=31243 RepID=A0A914I0U9_GLORO